MYLSISVYLMALFKSDELSLYILYKMLMYYMEFHTLIILSSIEFKKIYYKLHLKQRKNFSSEIFAMCSAS